MGRIKRVNRLKVKEEEFKVEQFYIAVVNTDTYQLRDVDSQYTISTANSLDDILRCFMKILKKYRSFTALNRKMQGMSEKENNTKTLSIKTKEYKKQGKTYVKEMQTVLEEFQLSLEKKRERFKPTTPPVENNIRSVEKKPLPLPVRIPRRRGKFL